MFRAERVRSTTDSRLVTVQRELTACKEQSDKFLGQRDKLTVELRGAKEKVRNLEGDLMGTKGEAAKYLAALKDILYRVQPLVATPKKEEEAPKVDSFQLTCILGISIDKVFNTIVF